MARNFKCSNCNLEYPFGLEANITISRADNDFEAADFDYMCVLCLGTTEINEFYKEAKRLKEEIDLRDNLELLLPEGAYNFYIDENRELIVQCRLLHPENAKSNWMHNLSEAGFQCESINDNSFKIV